jgi:general L-amino acid transport system substrate-binding protein
VFLLAVLWAPPALSSVLEDVQSRGTLRCGVGGELAGLSLQSDSGAWSGLDVDLCRAVAAAVLGDADKVSFVRLSNQERLDALAAGKVDLLARNTTWTLQRDSSRGMSFVGVFYYDGQGLMLPKERNLRSALELDNATVCVQRNTTSVVNAKRYFSLHRMRLRLLPFDDVVSQRQAYLNGECEAITADQSQLYALRAQFPQPSEHRILPEVISKEPLSPAVRKGDAQWFDIVRWTLFVLIGAEELGLTSDNVERARSEAENPDVRRLLGVEGDSGRPFGLQANWAFQIVRQVGNYQELFQRNLAPLGIRRGLNALWRDGGLMYSPPLR